jgi:putative restriction endonuclease
LKVVLDTRPGSGYLDSADRYHFPGRYLKPALEALGQWVVLYEPRREGGRAAYVAAARLAEVTPDPERPGHHFARLVERLPFDAPVPLRGPLGYREAPLRAVEDPKAVGRALQGRSIRPLSDDDFAQIVNAGLGETLAPANRRRLDLDPIRDPGLAALLDGPVIAPRLERALASRIVRDAAFRLAVLGAYKDTCAATGMRIINGGGRAEAQAAHIVPVSEGGPDVVQNGIALSATVHWLFDRHLISIGEDWGLLVSHNRVPVELRGLMESHASGIHLPRDRALWPDPRFVAHHRERFASAA